MALSKDIVIRLIADHDQAIAAQKALAKELDVSVTAVRRAERAFEQQQKATEAASRKQKAAMQEVGTAATGFGLAMVAGLGMAAKAAMDWESAWAGVTKTVSGTDAELAQVEKGLRDLTGVLPASHAEIAAVAEAAGQLGVQTSSIVDFTRTMVDLGETTNLTADEAATSLAQLMNVMQTAPEDVGRLGSALVALGNDGASTEADIVRMASYITGSARLIGASESDVLALANAMTSMGINAERGGGVMTRVMQDVYTAVQSGGGQLEGFADVAGMSSAEFARAFEADPIRAIDSFIQGLNTVEASGGNVVETLGNLGYVGTQDTAVLLQLKGAGDLLTESLDLGNQAWEDNNALAEEAAKRYETTAAKLEIARNGLNEAGIEIGAVFLPVLADLAGGLASVAQWFAGLPDPIKAVLGSLGAVAGVGALAGGAFLLLTPRVVDTVQAFKTLNTTHPGVTSGLGKVGKAAGAAGIAFTALQVITSAFGQSSDELDRFASKAQALGGTAVEGQIKSLTEEIERQQAVVDEAAISWEIFGIGIFSDQDAKDSADRIDVLNERIEALRHQKEMDAIASGESEEASKRQSEQTQILAADLDTAYGSIEGYAAALGLSEDATKDLIAKTSELGQSLADFINPLGVYTTMLDEKAAREEEAARKAAESAGASAESWQDFVTDTGFSFDEYMRRLEEQVTAQANWQTNMLTLAGRVSQGTLDELARMGPEGAPLVADLVSRSDEELDRFDEITALRSKEATDAWGAQLTMAAPVLAQIGKTAGSGVVAELAAQLAAGTTTVAAIAAQYGISLAGGINPILEGLGRSGIDAHGIYRAPGFVGPVQWPNADGNLYESHQAEIAPGGAWRVWAEPETGGEAYIPLSPAKRARSLNIWQETGRRLNAFADGGFSSVDDVPRPYSTAPYGPPISTAGDATMQKAYGETVDWLKANLAPVLGPGIGYQAMMAALRTQFPGLALNSGPRPGSITATGNLSYHASGRAVDVPPRSDVFEWIYQNYFAQTRELIFSPKNGRQIWNGSHHMYSEPTRGDHWDHVHWAMANGGIIGEPVVGMGLRTGASYSFGERGPETVLPGVHVGGGVGGGGAVAPNIVVNARVFVGNREITDIARVEAASVVAGRDATLARNMRSS